MLQSYAEIPADALHILRGFFSLFSFSYIFGSKTDEKAAGKFLSWSLSAAII